jgi:hypothetical protein
MVIPERLLKVVGLAKLVALSLLELAAQSLAQAVRSAAPGLGRETRQSAARLAKEPIPLV